MFLNGNLNVIDLCCDMLNISRDSDERVNITVKLIDFLYKEDITVIKFNDLLSFKDYYFKQDK